MPKPIYVLIFSLFTTFISQGQEATCEKLIKLMQADIKQTYWDSTNYTLEHFYCAGNYFAQQDIEKGIYIIQTYTNPDWIHPCKICKYTGYGFSFKYHKSAQWDTKTSFIEGYNELAEGYLRSKLTDSAFSKLNDISEGYFNPAEALKENFDNSDRRKLLLLDVVNDTTINVKLLVGKIFRDHPQFLDKIVYHVSGYDPTTKISEQDKALNYKQITETGFRLNKKGNGDYYFKIAFDFKGIPPDEKYCWCKFTSEKEYSYIIPLIIK